MATLRYSLSKRVQPNGKAEVLARFNANAHTSLYAHTHIYAPAQSWNARAGAVFLPNKATIDAQSIIDTQTRLNTLQTAIFNVWEKSPTIGKRWLQDIADLVALAPSEIIRRRLPDVVEEYIDHRQPSPRMADQYRVLQRALQEYEILHEPLYADTLTPDIVARFFRYYRTRPIATQSGTQAITRAHNTIASKERMLAAICSFAVRRGYIQHSPFGRKEDGLYAPREEIYGDVIYLTPQERDTLANYPLPEPLVTIRDIFIFQCHIGCRVSDLLTFTPDNIDGDFLQYIPIKTRGISASVVRVPIDDVARAIIDRYKGGSRLLPFVNASEYNRNIHNIARIAGLKRKVIVLEDGQQVMRELWQVCTSHTARKTFVQNIFAHTRSAIVAAAFTGHSPNTRAFRRYSEVSDQMKKDILQEISHGKRTDI